MAEKTEFEILMEQGNESHGVMFYQGFADVLRRVMKDGVFKVVFVKKSNYEERTMICTLNPERIAEETGDTAQETQSERAYNPQQVRCFDLEKKAWRSFLVDSDLKLVEQIDQP